MKKRTPIIGSILAATMFLAIGVGTTLALYSSNKTVNVHLVSGSLDAELYMTNMVRDELDSDGLWIVDEEVDLSVKTGYVADKGVDLSVNNEEVFSDIKIVPGMKGSASFKLYNTGDVAFNYTVSIINQEHDDELYAQLEIEYPDETGLLKIGEDVEFSVSYEFLDQDDNNDAMGQSVSFDISVLCTQVARDS